VSPDARTALSRRGWSLLGAGSGLLVAGRLLGADVLTTVGLGALALIGVALLWTRGRHVSVELHRAVRPHRTTVGADARVDLELVASAATPTLVVTDAFDGGRRAARFVGPALAPGQRARAAYRVPTDRRGRFAVGPARVVVADPFGLTHRAAVLGGTDDVLVRPRVADLRGALAAPGFRRATARRHQLVATPAPAQDEFLALREYVTGDDLRRVHWRSTARVGELTIREDESAWLPRTLVVFDNRRSSYPTDAEYEHAIEAIASIGVLVARRGRTAEIVTTRGRRLGGERRDTIRPELLLDELALLAPDADTSTAGLRALGARSRRGLLVVVTGAPADWAHLANLRGPGAPLVLVTTAAAGPPSAGPDVVDGRPEHLVESWGRAVRTRAAVRRAAG
jgi:uncharacterized protein (DUF58 family)